MNRTADGGFGSKSKGYDTNDDTNLREELKDLPEGVDFMVELSGIEPLASSLRTRRSPS